MLVLLALIGSYAIPKYMNTKQAAVVTTVKRDIATITSSLQSYFLLHGEIDDINDALTLGNNNWQIDNKTITYKSSGQDCITIRVNEQEQELELNINETLDTICEKLSNAGIKDTKTALY